MKAQLVIFDCDGVLVDSEVIACRVDAELFTEHGFPTTADEVMERYVGRSAAFMISDIEMRHGRPLPAEFPALMHEQIASAFDRELRAIDGIGGIVARIVNPKCVASSSTPQRIERSLRVAGLWDFFNPHIFSATQVERGKPAPDLFLFAARQMSAAPDDSIVIEDSVAGVEAARAAGMKVIGFTAGSHCLANHEASLRRAGATEIVSNSSELGQALGLS
jgi:HAD superfamily hydrolase (TIGR01509 family)